MSERKTPSVTLTGASIERPDVRTVLLSDELDEGTLDKVAGGISLFQGRANALETVKYPAGVGAFHTFAWKVS